MKVKRAGRIAIVAAAFTFALGGLAWASEAQGTVHSVDPTGGHVVLDNGSVLAVDQSTQIRVEGRLGRLEDLQPGQRVKAAFQDENGENVATTIDISQGRPANSQGTQGRTK